MCISDFDYMYVHAGQKGCQIPWNWRYEWLWAVMSLLRIELRSSGKAPSAFNHRVITPAVDLI